VLLQTLWKNVCETIRNADVLVVFVRERTTITPVDCVTEKYAQKTFMYILIVIIMAEIDTSKAASVGITRKGIDKNTAVRVFFNGKKTVQK
jgi:hypothetical protein